MRSRSTGDVSRMGAAIDVHCGIAYAVRRYPNRVNGARIPSHVLCDPIAPLRRRYGSIDVNSTKCESDQVVA